MILCGCRVTIIPDDMILCGCKSYKDMILSKSELDVYWYDLRGGKPR